MNKIYNIGVIGMGPAGIGLVLGLEKNSLLEETICFEQGLLSPNVQCNQIENGECCSASACHVISGIGGASNLSSGKISDFPAGSKLSEFFDSEQELESDLGEIINYLKTKLKLKHVEIDHKIKSSMVLNCTKNNVNYKYYDVYTFDGDEYQKYLFDTITDLMKKGLNVKQGTKVVKVDYDDKLKIYSIIAKRGELEFETKVRNLVIGTGNLHINNDILTNLGISNDPSYEIGVRIESKSTEFNEMVNSHGDLKLKFNNGRTYCVTKDGIIVVYKVDNLYFLEGSDVSNELTGLTNLAIMVKRLNSIGLSGFLANYEKEFGGIPVKQSFNDYVSNNSNEVLIESTCSMAKSGNVNRLFTADINNEIKTFIKKIVIDILEVKSENITIIAPELKISNNIGLLENFEIRDNLYVIGAATGKFRGILQSFCSGMKCSKQFFRGC